MEHNPHGPNPFESSPEGSDTPDKDKSKKKKSFRAPLGIPASEQSTDQMVSSEKITRLADVLAVQPERPQPDLEAQPDVLSTEETGLIQQDIAQNHLDAMQDVDAETATELAPASDFLERVQAGEDTEIAFASVAAELGMNEDEIAEALAEESVTDADMESRPIEESYDDAVETPAYDDTILRLRQPRPPTTGSAVQPAQSTVAPLPAVVLPNRADTYYAQRRSNVGSLLVTGAVGYILGRRRGRIKTEKKLLPVQQKLEQQVTRLERNITTKEQQLVVAKARLAERVPSSRRAERPVVNEQRRQPGRQESRLDMQKPVQAEHIGHMIVAAETPKPRLVVERPKSIRQGFRAEEVPLMRRNELLELSEKIVVEGASLRRIYESRLIGEKQLRHLVSEYLQGKDIQKDLRREMVEHEIDFERDPQLRDRVRAHLKQTGGGGGLSDLLASVGVIDTETDPQVAHRARREAERQAAQQKKARRQKITNETALVTVIVLLAVAVVVLAFGR